MDQMVYIQFIKELIILLENTDEHIEMLEDEKKELREEKNTMEKKLSSYQTYEDNENIPSA